MSTSFSMKTAVLEGAAMCTGSILHVDNDSDAEKTESVRRLLFLFCNILHIWTTRAIPTSRIY